MRGEIKAKRASIQMGKRGEAKEEEKSNERTGSGWPRGRVIFGGCTPYNSDVSRIQWRGMP